MEKMVASIEKRVVITMVRLFSHHGRAGRCNSFPSIYFYDFAKINARMRKLP
ncbi:hypothetical protein J2Z84_003339 [Agrobacterium rubi]|nr:hypothetical protein [Agrobacterium rubi]